MAIKKVKKENVGAVKQVKKVEPVEVEEVYEDVIEEVEDVVEEEIYDEEVEEVYDEMEEEDAMDEEEEVEEEVVVVQQPKVTKVKKATNKETTKKKAIGKKQAAKPQEEKKIGTVYPKELILKNVQAALSEEFDISLADLRKIMDALENELIEASQVASIRFLGGILKAGVRNASVNKAPKVDYYSYTGERTVLTLTGATLGQPEEYRGVRKGDKFIIKEKKNEEGKFVPAKGTIDLSK